MIDNDMEKVEILYQPRKHGVLSLMALMGGLVPGMLPNIKMRESKTEHVCHQGERERARRQRQKDKIALKAERGKE